MLSFAGSLRPDSDGFAIFVTENFKYRHKKNILSTDVVKKIDSFLKVLKSKKKREDISSFDISDKKKCFVIKVKKNQKNYYPEENGGTFFSYLKKFQHIVKLDFYADSLDFEEEYVINFFSEFVFGFNLKSYTFDKYKTLNREKNNKISFKIVSQDKDKIKNKYKYYDAIKEGVFLTRDLVSEPPNILNPEKYVQEIKKLSKLGLKISVYNEAKMKKMGMNAIWELEKGAQKNHT